MHRGSDSTGDDKDAAAWPCAPSNVGVACGDAAGEGGGAWAS